MLFSVELLPLSPGSIPPSYYPAPLSYAAFWYCYSLRLSIATLPGRFPLPLSSAAFRFRSPMPPVVRKVFLKARMMNRFLHVDPSIQPHIYVYAHASGQMQTKLVYIRVRMWTWAKTCMVYRGDVHMSYTDYLLNENPYAAIYELLCPKSYISITPQLNYHSRNHPITTPQPPHFKYSSPFVPKTAGDRESERRDRIKLKIHEIHDSCTWWSFFFSFVLSNHFLLDWKFCLLGVLPYIPKQIRI